MVEKGELIYEYPNYKTKWVWVAWLSVFIILQICWILIFSIMIIENLINISSNVFISLVLILEFCAFLILFIAYDDSNSFGTPFKIYNNGFVSPRRTFIQYLKNEVEFIFYEQIKKIKIEVYKNNSKYNYIKFEILKNKINSRFLFSMIGYDRGMKKIESALKEKIPEIWSKRETIKN